MTGEKGYNLAVILLLGKDDIIHSCLPACCTDAIFREQNRDCYDDPSDSGKGSDYVKGFIGAEGLGLSESEWQRIQLLPVLGVSSKTSVQKVVYKIMSEGRIVSEGGGRSTRYRLSDERKD